MHSKNIIFQHGHIYDAETKKRILVKEGIPYVILLQSINNVEESTFQKIEGKNTTDIVKEIEKLEGLTHYKKIASKDSTLYFHLSEKDENKTGTEKNIGNDDKQVKKSSFTITLLEDLFLYSRKHWSKKLIEDGKLFDCACVVNESKDNELLFFEPIYANSIASVYKKTHVHYFGNEGSPSQNTFDSVCFLNETNTLCVLEYKRRFTDADKYAKTNSNKN